MIDKCLRQCVVALLFFFSGQLLAANDKAFFWKVESNESTVYLLGSIHFADKSFYPLRPEIIQAYEESQALVVELDINKAGAQTYQKLVNEQGVYRGNRTIKDEVSHETYLQLRQRLKDLNVPYDSVKRYKPGILVLTLTSVQVMKMGFDPQHGIDAYFLNKAASQSKDIIELESLQQQLQLFLNIPNGDLLLQESLYSLDESNLMMSEMVSNWKLGSDQKMTKMLFDDALEAYPAFTAIYEQLFYQRNEKMTEKVVQLLQQEEGVYFVVVGTGHLVGDRGMVKQLEDKGYAPVRH